MFELIHPGRALVLDSPLGAAELTRRLEGAFDGTFAEGRFRVMRRVRGRNSFRSVVDGQVVPASGGSRLDVRLRLHPLILVVGALYALLAGTLASVASPELPAVGRSPLLVGVLATAAVAFAIVLLGSMEARTSKRLLSTLAEGRTGCSSRTAASASTSAS